MSLTALLHQRGFQGTAAKWVVGGVGGRVHASQAGTRLCACSAKERRSYQMPLVQSPSAPHGLPSGSLPHLYVFEVHEPVAHSLSRPQGAPSGCGLTQMKGADIVMRLQGRRRRAGSRMAATEGGGRYNHAERCKQVLSCQQASLAHQMPLKQTSSLLQGLPLTRLQGCGGTEKPTSHCMRQGLQTG